MSDHRRLSNLEQAVIRLRVLVTEDPESDAAKDANTYLDSFEEVVKAQPR